MERGRHVKGRRAPVRRRTGLLAGGALVAVFALLIGLTLTSGGGDSQPSSPASTPPTLSESASSATSVDPKAPRVITFPGSAGSAPDAKAWNYETGGNGWGNGELQTYTSSTANAFVDGTGRLVIRAIKGSLRGSDGITRQYSSARITTARKVVIQPGSYVSATMTVPTAAGVWPAFWLIGADVDSVGWPQAGELDVYEGDAPSPSIAQAAIHLPSSADPSVDKPYDHHAPGGAVDIGVPLDAAPHEYGVYFDGSVVRFFVDRKPTMVVTAADATAAGRLWPFAKPQYLILNVAIAGSGNASSASFPQDLVVENISIWPAGIPFSF